MNKDLQNEGGKRKKVQADFHIKLFFLRYCL